MKIKKALKKYIWLLVALVILVGFWFSLPAPLFNAPTCFVVKASNGHLLSAAIAADGQWRFPIADTVPHKFAKCITSFEDKRFYQHFGVDFWALARAIKINIKNQKTKSGASTLSMQVIRLSRNKPRTIWQKTIEMVLAFRLELSYSKPQILALYASNAPFGSNVVGLEAAAWRYYGRQASTLSWAEMATLAVLPNAPSLIHLGKNRVALLKKRNALLDKLSTQNTIDKSTCQLAKLEAIPQSPLALPQNAPHLLDRFKQDFSTLKADKTLLISTINETLQHNVASIIKRYHQQYKANGINNAAALVLDIETGNTLAYIGNIYEPQNPEMESHVDMIKAVRSPGSTLKPLLYASMLTDGMLLPNTLIADIPTQIGGYTPQNYDLGYDGAIPAAKALSRSLNIPAVKMLQQYKYERFYQQLKKLGITSLNNPADFYGLSIILGGCETSMWQLSGVYASMARTLNHYPKHPQQYNFNDYHQPQYISQKNQNEQLSTSSVLDYGSIYYTFAAMQEVMRPGEELLWEQFSSSQKIAWKTGTSFGFRDGWAIGLTSKYLVCVWVGNADGEGRPELTGIKTAAPMLFDIFNLLPASAPFVIPYRNMAKVLVCKKSGYRASMCAGAEDVYMPKNALKSALCPYHQLIHVNKTKTYRVNSACATTDNMLHINWFVLPPAMAYYYKIRHPDYEALPPLSPTCTDEQDAYRPLELIYPKNNAKIYIPTEINGNKGKVIFSAAHRNTQSKIYWWLDDVYISTTFNLHELALNPSIGKHSITLEDDRGNKLMQVFEVLGK